MKKLFAIGFTTFLVLGAGSGFVSAHPHYIETPKGKEVQIPVEPYHDDEVVNGAVLNNHVNGQGPGYLHPIHYLLHTGPSSENRKIEVKVGIVE